MKTRYRAPVLAALLPLVLLSVGCDLVRAKAAFKDGNRLYKEENYRKAIDEYEKAVQRKPDFAEAHFYLASSQQSLYRPGKEGDENRMRLDKAVEHFERALELNKGGTPNLQQLRLNTLGALTSIYSEPPLSNYEKALGFAEQLVKDNPNDVKNLYAMANLYEKFGRVAEAEQAYVKAADIDAKDVKACGALASFYNKPLWDEKGEVWVEGKSPGARRIKFDLAITTLGRCADIDPANPNGHYTLAMFYWDKAYRDPVLGDKEKNEFADKGIEAVDLALQTQPDHVGSVVAKGLLYRVKALLAKNPADRKRYLDQAILLQKQGAELRKEQQAASAAGAGTDIPPETAAATEAPKP